MSTHIQFNRSCIAGATPDAESLLEGEPSVNLADVKLWVKGCSGELINFIDGITGERVAGSNGEIQFKDTNGFSASSDLIFNGMGISANGGVTFGRSIKIIGSDSGISFSDGSSQLTGITGINNLNDVTLSNVLQKDILIYDIVEGRFENSSISGAGISQTTHNHSLSSLSSKDLNDLDDVVIGTVADKQVISYNNTSSIWWNRSLSDAGISETGHTHDINDLADVNITFPSLGNLLTYDTASGKWIDQTPASAGLSETGHTHTFVSDITDMPGATGNAGQYLKVKSDTTGVEYGNHDEIIGIRVDNGSSALTTGVKGHRVLPYDCEVVEWTATSSISGTIQWHVNWCTYANWPTTASVENLDINHPQIGASTKNQDTTVTWDTQTFSAGDILEFEITIADGVLTDCTVSLKIRRTG
jgi:hypothetical protein